MLRGRAQLRILSADHHPKFIPRKQTCSTTSATKGRYHRQIDGQFPNYTTRNHNKQLEPYNRRPEWDGRQHELVDQ